MSQFSFYQYDLNKLQDTGLIISKTEKFKLSRFYSQPQYGQPSISDRVGDLLQSEIRCFTDHGEPQKEALGPFSFLVIKSLLANEF